MRGASRLASTALSGCLALACASSASAQQAGATPGPSASAPAVAKPSPTSSSAAPRATSPVAETLGSQIGSWDCTIAVPGVKDDQRVLVSWSAYGTNWIRGSAEVSTHGARPAHRADFAFGYDPAAKLWLSVYTDSLGAYAVSKSTAAPTAKSFTFVDAYPVDSHDGPSKVTLGATTATIDSAWEIAGVAHTSHERCEKI